MASENVFNGDLLAMYYDHLFPYEEFARWLSYGKGESLLSKREFSFTLENDVYIRYKAFANAQEMKAAMTKTQPHKIDLGAVFSVSPMDKAKVSDSAFKPMERELIFDIDLTDYDDIRTCCEGAAICEKCWNFMIAAVKVMNVALREDFGFEHILWVYSGRRGIHCWVGDYQARQLANDARSAIVQYFTVVEGNENVKRKVILREPLHPFLERALNILEPIFENHILAENGQNILGEQKHWTTLLNMIPDKELRHSLDQEWSNSKRSLTAYQKWNMLKESVSKLVHSSSKKRGNEEFRKSMALSSCINEIILAYTYPRLDANVSKQRNHLLKSPFAVHPKTGRVCVPIDPNEIEAFDPFKVPTLGQLEQEINDTSTDPANEAIGVAKTCLYQYIQFFDREFIRPMEKGQLMEKREDAEKSAAINGDW